MDPFYHFAINIPANRIEQARDWMTKRCELIWMEDYQSEIADFKNWNAKSIYFLDPAGNIVELIARSDLHNESEDNFTSKDFLSINEIGMVSTGETMDERVNNMSKLGLELYSKQKPLPHFRVIGDETGLFIIVPEGRNWYPTEIKARCFPMVVTFKQGVDEYEIEDVVITD
jgi:catechol-2,3-dioxygenase